MESFKCKGDAALLRWVLSEHFPKGYWTKGPHGKRTYRTRSGGVVQFWPSTKRIHCQGPEEIAAKLDRLLRREMRVVDE